MDLRCKYSPSLGVAVTGSTGFIGSQLLNTFKVADFKAIPVELIEDAAVIIHLAADVSSTRHAMLTNIAIDTFLLEVVNQKHKGLIYASSNNIYPYALDCRINEFPRCNDHYAASKIFGEKIYSEWTKVPTVSVRIADVFGVGQRHGNFFKAIERSIQTEASLQQYGRGLKRRTYIHIQELCESLKFIALHGLEDRQPSRSVNLGYADSASIAEILDMVSELTCLTITNIPLEVEKSQFDVRTMQPSLLNGYTPCWGSFREALSAYVDKIKSKK